LVLETTLHGPKPERVADALADLRARPVGAEERRREILEELRTVGGDAGADGIELLEIGRPAGLACVLSISGGTALTNTALATRLVPWRPM
jgi:hypothetical protein